MIDDLDLLCFDSGINHHLNRKRKVRHKPGKKSQNVIFINRKRKRVIKIFSDNKPNSATSKLLVKPYGFEYKF